MTDPVRPVFHGFEQIPLREYAERAYLDYSMYVVLDRALPFLGDGLKPVQRRIIYAMSELGLNAGAKPKKSARTVGDVIGKFHPHGDQRLLRGAGADGAAVLVPLSADRGPGQLRFAGRSEIVRGDALHRIQADADRRSAAGRTRPGHGRLDAELRRHLEEPTWMPARLPHLLLNGTTGIAVGMATDVPPHNLNEIVSACVRLLDDPDATVRDLCEHVRGPDYPTTAEIITPAADLLAMYETGYGSVRARGTFAKEHAEHRHHRAALPGVAVEGDRADRRADARQEAAVAGGHPRRIRPREPGAHGADPALATASMPSS